MKINLYAKKLDGASNYELTTNDTTRPMRFGEKDFRVSEFSDWFGWNCVCMSRKSQNWSHSDHSYACLFEFPDDCKSVYDVKFQILMCINLTMLDTKTGALLAKMLAGSWSVRRLINYFPTTNCRFLISLNHFVFCGEEI